MLARFFIDRPILAWVISIVIVLFGAIAGVSLPIAQYPSITPPVVRVSASYPGASAAVVADTVAAPIEQQINGVEGMLYMQSQSSNEGTYTLDVTFELGTDLNMAQVLVQNRIALATPTLPDVVKAVGVTVKKRSPDILMIVSLYSEDNPATGKPYHDQLFISNYSTINVIDHLARVEGVGDVLNFGTQDYSMRVWVDPDKLASRGLAAGDVVKVLREQNVQVAAGQIGQAPVPRGQQFQFPIRVLGRLVEPEQFGEIVLGTGADGEVTYLRDVARVELGARNQDVGYRLDGRPSIGLGVFQLPGSNALDVAEAIKKSMTEMEARFPTGLKWAAVYDTTPFIRESVKEVRHTLRDAVILVAVVVLLFLQDWKSLLLPLIDVAVSLVGTLAVMKLMGFSLNNLTLFGLVLAIGIVVDDAIVVLENIERWLEKGLPVREATIQAMSEITGPIVAITLVLSSVLLPSAFLGGITGQFYRQFALTISASMIISAVNAMTMTPARASAIFAGRSHGPDGHLGKEALPKWFGGLVGGVLAVMYLGDAFGRWTGLAGGQGLSGDVLAAASDLLAFAAGAAVGLPVGYLVVPLLNRVLGVFFRGFNWAFDRVTRVYGWGVGRAVRLSVVVLVAYAGLVAVTGWGFTRVPTGFIPTQDKGRIMVNIQLPDSASVERTTEVAEKFEHVCHTTPGISNVIIVSGRSFILNAIGPNLGAAFVVLDPFHDRRDPDKYVDAIIAQLRKRCQDEIPEARINIFGAPAVDGLGNSGGFKLMVQATGDVDYLALQGQSENLAEQGNKQPGLVGLFSSLRADTPQLFAHVDRTKCKAMKVPLSDAFDALQVYLGGYYVNDINRFGRTWQVNVQADAKFRTDPEAVKQLKVRNADGDMVPLGTLIDIKDVGGPLFVTRYNMFPAATVAGAGRPDVSVGDVQAIMEGLAQKELPQSMTSEWTELSYLQKQSGQLESLRDLKQNPFSAFVLGVVLVFFVLAGLYESWSLPLAVILVVPMCLLSALAGIALAGMDVNIFVQVGFVVLVGLAAKNAILIVEFARDRQAEGATLRDAAVQAAVARLRPIVMTSLAFILGVVPLVLAEGAGAEMRRTLGTAVFAGMIGVTVFGLVLTPVFFYVVRWFGVRRATPATAVALVPAKHEPVPDRQPAHAGR